MYTQRELALPITAAADFFLLFITRMNLHGNCPMVSFHYAYFNVVYIQILRITETLDGFEIKCRVSKY